jgi:nucleotide-binding universal stress UspA family protein
MDATLAARGRVCSVCIQGVRARPAFGTKRDDITAESPVYAPPSYIDEFLNALREGGKKIFATAEAKVRKRGVRTDAVLVETLGHRVADVIIGQAKKWRADLIVLGTHWRRGLTRLVMGSDAEGVVRSTGTGLARLFTGRGAATRQAKQEMMGGCRQGGNRVANVG